MKKIILVVILSLVLVFFSACDQNDLDTLSKELGSSSDDVEDDGLSKITYDDAISIALKDAGLDTKLVDVTADKKEIDENNIEYDIIIKDNDNVYEYVVDGISGKIKSSNFHSNSSSDEKISAVESSTASSSVPNSNNNSGNRITMYDAKKIALNHAGVSFSEVRFVKTKRDYDDGRDEFEIEFYANGKEYDYDIDAITGEILSYDNDVEGFDISAGSTSNYSGEDIGQQKAKEIVLDKVSGATESNITKFETDYDDGRLVYEGEIHYNGVEYEFEVDGATGTIIEWDVD